MTAPQKIQETVSLGSTDGLGIVQVNTRNFEAFDESITLRTIALMQQWKHAASPNAQRRPQRRSAPGQQPLK